MQRRNAADVAFSAYSTDTEDYANFLSSDESMSDVDDVPERPKTVKSPDPVEELAATFACSSSISSSVLTPIGALNGIKPLQPSSDKRREVPAPGVFSQGGGHELRVSSSALKQHEARRSKLQEALDAIGGGDEAATSDGEAPFRFMTQQRALRGFVAEMEDSEASPAPMTERVEGHAPEKKGMGRRRSASGAVSSADSDEETVEPDLLYDEQLDDADEKWVLTNLRGDRVERAETDATLCCPCCFVTVCMTCERHATYTNQYRATAAINCRVKKEEILTYTTSEDGKVPASLPFQKRQNLVSKIPATTTGQQIARLLQEDEFYAVACSDCGTMVGVFDRDQQYHFFNALPSNC